jgi:hypothetical protein
VAKTTTRSAEPYPELPYLNPVLGDMPHFLAYLEGAGKLDASDLALLRRAGFNRPRSRSGSDGPRCRPCMEMRTNPTCLKTARGFLGTDFEPTCSGPVAWDTACVARTSSESVAAALAN